MLLTKDGLPTLDAVYNRSLAAIKKRMDYNKQLSCHVLRHTFATRCIESGITPKTLRMWMGHSDISLTMNRYVHTTFEESEREMLKFVLCS
ncbi:MAG: tyrosine-type recombinase/integrase [Lachnospiraceae bacterium]|nr:tyrosine-type recombinase/integrase [Lachnospiraceae bacterium]